MAVALILISLIVIFLIWKLEQSQRRPAGIPPGPRRWPIVGNFLNVGFKPYETFANLAKIHGPVFSFDFGSYPAVVINDLKLIKQALNDNATAGRPELYVFIQRACAPNQTFARGIITSKGQLWNEQRRFMLRNLKDFGFGRNTMESIIMDDVKEFMESIPSQVGNVVNPSGLFNAAVLNSFWGIVAGGRAGHDDEKRNKVLVLVFQLVSDLSFLVLFYPVLTKWFPNISGYNSAMAHVQPLYDFVKESYEEHKETLTPGYPRDLIDAVADEIASTKDPTSTFYGDDGEFTAIKSLVDLFLSSAETTSTTLEWICLLLVLNPQVQDKMYSEIFKVIGDKDLPRLTDQGSMPYTECVILESLRITSMLPMALPHSTTKSVNIGGYIIPPDTLILPNLYAVHHSEEIWGDPEVFCPERFILPDGSANRSHEALLAFGTGKRICIGNQSTTILTTPNLYCFNKSDVCLIRVSTCTSVFQKYRLSADPFGPKPTLAAKPRLLLTPKHYGLIFHPR